jgi:hypothetical protein
LEEEEFKKLIEHICIPENKIADESTIQTLSVKQLPDSQLVPPEMSSKIKNKRLFRASAFQPYICHMMCPQQVAPQQAVDAPSLGLTQAAYT